MNDEQLAKVFSEGNLKSNAEGLRAVYEAGRNHDKWVKTQSAVIGAAGTAEHEPFGEMTNAELRSYLDGQGVAYASNSDKSELERMARNAARKAK